MDDSLFAIGPDKAVIDIKLFFGCDCAPGRVINRLPIVRMDKLTDKCLITNIEFLRINAEDSIVLVRPGKSVGDKVAVPTPNMGQPLGFGQFVFALPQLLLGLFTFSNVM